MKARVLGSAALTMAGLTLAGCGVIVATPHSSTSTTTAVARACTDRAVTGSLASSLTLADGRPGAKAVPGAVYYGTCGRHGYAVAAFEPSSSATSAQSVAFQDHGAYPEFFERTGVAHWRVVGSAPGPPGAKSCAAFRRLPSGLRSLWGDCVAPTPTTTLAPWCVTLMTETFIRAQSIVVDTDGSASVTGVVLGVRCSPGTPDDVQFHDLVAGEAPATVRLVAGATVTGVDLSGGSIPLTLSALASYLADDTDGNLFRVVGPLDAATGLLGRFHP